MNYLLDECDADLEQRGVYEVQEDRSRHQVKACSHKHANLLLDCACDSMPVEISLC